MTTITEADREARTLAAWHLAIAPIERDVLIHDLTDEEIIEIATAIRALGEA